MSALLKPEERVLSTLNADGSRRWLEPKAVTGFFVDRRRLLGWVLIAVFVALPHLHAGGRQVFLLDIARGEFTLFGLTFLRTDTLMLALTAIAVFVGVFLLTALFGRVWCGWGCPQTVYLEFVFRPIGRLFDGKGRSGLRGAISALPGWMRNGARWGLVGLVCFALSNTFLAYFVGSRAVLSWSTQAPWAHPAGFAFVLFVTGLMVGNFGFFREQLCFIACPYGRFQSVMLDRHSLIVGYDRRRGEPRGKAARGGKRATRAESVGGESVVALSVMGTVMGAGLGVGLGVGPEPTSGDREAGAAGAGRNGGALGDCVDCGRCVAVCPTGIDIRDGLQMECIHCARCIDACDEVMTKLSRPTGLVRYASQAVLDGERSRVVRPRALIYPAILAVVIGSLFALAAGHAPADTRLLRDRGAPFYTLPTGEISNAMRLRVTNRTREVRGYTVEAAGPGFRVEPMADAAGVGPGETRSIPLRVIAEASVLAGRSGVARLPIRISDDGGYETVREVKFLGPMSIRGRSPGAATQADEGGASR